MNIKIFKSDGTKNTFVIIYDNDNHNKIIKNIKFICNKFKTDGMLLISDTNNYDFKMDYFNNDGTWETMCANGARCAGLLMWKIKKCSKNITFVSGDGPHKLNINNSNNISLSFKTPNFKTDEIELFNYTGRFVDSGAKHFAILTNIINENIVKEYGPKIRNHKAFKPEGVNVNFFKIVDKNHIIVYTYEKGVESMVMSCGTGSIACAFYAYEKKLIKSPLKVTVPGGELNITFDQNWEEVWVSGPSNISEPIEINI